jgi:hypothetical protein
MTGPCGPSQNRKRHRDDRRQNTWFQALDHLRISEPMRWVRANPRSTCGLGLTATAPGAVSLARSLSHIPQPDFVPTTKSLVWN